VAVLRSTQAQVIAEIVAARTRPNSAYIITGDVNDPPDSEWLEPMVTGRLGLANALTRPAEIRPAKADNPAPLGPAWTHRFKQTAPTQHQTRTPPIASLANGVGKYARLAAEAMGST
jgi:endonuclease/exonuclease/phosphatase family metal-dependent hydrolase